MTRFLIDAFESQLALYLLALVRVSGIFFAAPFYSGPGIPIRMKAALAAIVALLLLPLSTAGSVAPVLTDAGVVALAIMAVQELALGFALGLGGALVMAAVQTAGHLIGQDIGFNMGSIIDPLTNEQSTVVSQLKAAIAMFLFVGLDLHHDVLRALRHSVAVVPLGGLGERLAALATGGQIEEMVIREGRFLLDASVRLALPVTVTLMVVTVGMAFLARAIPEMNVFALGFTLRSLVGIWVLALSLPVLGRAFAVLFERAGLEGRWFVDALAKAGG